MKNLLSRIIRFAVGKSDIIQVSKKFREDLLDGNDAAIRRMAGAYRDTLVNLRPQLQEISKKISEAGSSVKPAWLFQQQRYRELIGQCEAEIDRFSKFAASTVEQQQAFALEMGLKHSESLVQEALSKTIRWNHVPHGALQNLVGFFGDGSPLEKVFSKLAPEVISGMQGVITSGLAQGWNPRKMARAIENEFGKGLIRTELVCRTETLRAYRTSSLASYQENSDIVEGVIWICAQQRRTCAACWSMHGKFYRLDDVPSDHPGGRCTTIPKTKSWDQLAGKETGIENTSAMGFDNEERFVKLSKKDQRYILGKTKFEAWEAGDISLRDIAGTTYSKAYGTQVRIKTLEELGLGKDYVPTLPSPIVNHSELKTIDDIKKKLEELNAHLGAAKLDEINTIMKVTHNKKLSNIGNQIEKSETEIAILEKKLAQKEYDKKWYEAQKAKKAAEKVIVEKPIEAPKISVAESFEKGLEDAKNEYELLKGEQRLLKDAYTDIVDKYPNGGITVEDQLKRNKILEDIEKINGKLTVLNSKMVKLQEGIDKAKLPRETTYKFEPLKSTTGKIVDWEDRRTVTHIPELGNAPEAHKDRIMKDLSKRLENNSDFNKFMNDWYANTGNNWPSLERYGANTRERVVSTLISHWARTSGDSDTFAIALQIAAREEFGLVSSSLGHVSDRVIAEAKDLVRQYGAGMRAFMRVQYEATQEMFKAQGIKSVTLYRGCGFYKESAPSFISTPLGTPTRQKKAFSLKANQKTVHQPISSYSTDMGTCHYFSDRYGDYATMVGAEVPVSRILSTSRTGFGCLNEKEVVVLGGEDNVRFLAWHNGSGYGYKNAWKTGKGYD